MDEVLAALGRAKELVEAGWTQGTAARSRRGKRVPPKSPAAAAFCLSGALGRAAYELKVPRRKLLAAAGFQIGPPLFIPTLESIRIICWNDDPQRMKRDVMALLEKAMRRGKVTEELIIEPMPQEEGPPEREIKREDAKPSKERERELVPTR